MLVLVILWTNTSVLFVFNVRLHRRLEDVLKTLFVFVFIRRLQDVLIKTNIFTLVIRLQKTSSRRLQDVLVKTNIFVLAIRLQDVFKTSCKDIFKTFSRRIIRLNCLPRSHFWEIYGQCRTSASVIKFLKF